MDWGGGGIRFWIYISPTLLLSNFLIFAYFNHLIFVYNFSRIQFGTLYYLKILDLQNLKLENFGD